MARRSSARLRGRNSTTPKRVSLSHDAPAARTPRTLPARLASLNEEEDDEMPGAFPRSVSPAVGTPTRPAKRVNTGTPEATPKTAMPIKPSDQEMHPQKHHQTVVKPHEEARHLGFQSLGAHTEPAREKSSGIAQLQATPSRAHNNPPNPVNDFKSPSFQFTFRREHSLELSPDAKRLMLEKREEAVRIREQMTAHGEGAQESNETSRALATPKGKKGRFSGAHQEAFGKMASIAGHASAFRAKGTPKVEMAGTAGESTKTLKRSPSKAQLDDKHPSAKKTLTRSPSKPMLIQHGGGLPRPTSSHTLRQDHESSSPAKRMKRSEVEDVSATRPHSSDDNSSSQPSTPQQHKTLRMHPSNPNLASLTAATQASLARAASVKTNKTSMIPGPNLTRSPSKPALVEKPAIDEANTPLLARSPSKANLFASVRSEVVESAISTSPLLSRSPLKASVSRKVAADSREPTSNGQPVEAAHPLLARSPLKMSVAKNTDTSVAEPAQEIKVPLLARSPSKIALPSNPTTTQVTAPSTPGKASGLLSRFNLLRASPMKSILRSPQRLYSNDPAKVASGTHLATPPPKNGTLFFGTNKIAPQPAVPATAPVGSKRVDFTSSTKARYEVKEASSTPSSGPTPQPTKIDAGGAHAKDMEIDYPALPSASAAPSPVMTSPSPQKRRQTVAPGDFTFRAGGHSITFGTSPNSKGAAKRPSIRHVSAEPATIVPQRSSTVESVPAVQGSKKRKFEFENEEISAGENKENTLTSNPLTTNNDNNEDGEDRPAKRTKMASSEAPALAAAVAKTRESSVSPAKRVPTLGVKPKGAKTAIGGKERRETKSGNGKGATISQARLAALAMPKKRG
ncbi:hypothetical protein LTR86_010364 [Recurvomyces mirabilis]|nr:hypothetical protein LTR86_010364 [Recurvomyces mirabilis]